MWQASRDGNCSVGKIVSCRRVPPAVSHEAWAWKLPHLISLLHFPFSVDNKIYYKIIYKTTQRILLLYDVLVIALVKAVYSRSAS